MNVLYVYDSINNKYVPIVTGVSIGGTDDIISQINALNGRIDAIGSTNVNVELNNSHHDNITNIDYTSVGGRLDAHSSSLVDMVHQPALDTTNANVALKANTADMNTAIAAVSSGSPKGVYATLSALQTAFPTGNSNIYLVTSDGKWYYYTASAWTAGGTYQSTGLSAGTVTLTTLDGIARSFSYPFQTNCNFTKSGSPEFTAALRDGILDIQLIGADSSKNYSISQIQRKNGGVSTIDIWDSDSYVVVCSFYATNYVEPSSGIDTISLVTMNSSGITGTMKIDWSKFTNPCIYQSLIFSNAGLHKSTYANVQIKLNSDMRRDIDLARGLLEIYLTTSDYTHKFGISTITRNASMGANKYSQIDIYDYTANKVLCSWYQLNYSEPSGVDTLVMSSMDSGVSNAILKVNWAKIQTGAFNGLPLYFIPKTYSQINFDALNIRVKRWKGLKWYADGDSITAQNIYSYYLNIACEFASYYNAGQSGLGMQHMAEKFAIESLVTYDLITVFAGTNDYGGSTPLGTMADDKTVASFYGYIKMVIDAILTAKPTIRVAFFTPIQRGVFSGQPTFPDPNSLGFTLDQYVDAIITVCKSYAIPVLDLFRVSGINQYNLSNYLQDGLHPNNTGGGQLLAREMQSFIETL